MAIVVTRGTITAIVQTALDLEVTIYVGILKAYVAAVRVGTACMGRRYHLEKCRVHFQAIGSGPPPLHAMSAWLGTLIDRTALSAWELKGP